MLHCDKLCRSFHLLAHLLFRENTQNPSFSTPVATACAEFCTKIVAAVCGCCLPALRFIACPLHCVPADSNRTTGFRLNQHVVVQYIATCYSRTGIDLRWSPRLRCWYSEPHVFSWILLPGAEGTERHLVRRWVCKSLKKPSRYKAL